MHRSQFSRSFIITCTLCGKRRIRLPVGKWDFRVCSRCDRVQEESSG
jgi:hypothetical protein